MKTKDSIPKGSRYFLFQLALYFSYVQFRFITFVLKYLIFATPSKHLLAIFGRGLSCFY